MREQIMHDTESTVTAPVATGVAALRPLLDGIARLHDAVLLVDRAGSILWCNRAGLARLGVDDEGRGCRDGEWRDLLADGAESDRLLGEFHDRGAIAGRRISLRGVDGRPLPVELSVTRVHPAGSDAWLLVLLRGLNEHERDAEELHRRLGLLQAVLDGTPDPVFVVDRGGRLAFSNGAFADLVGRPKAALADVSMTRIADDVPPLGALASRITQGALTLIEEVTIGSCSGRSSTFAASAAPLLLPSGRRGGTLVRMRDVTRERQQLADLARQNAELETYVHSVSHDLRSPLASLLGFLRLLRDDHGPQIGESGRFFLDRIEQAGRSMETLINDLLELSRLGNAADRKMLVDPLRILRQLRAELKPRLEAQHVRLVFPETLPLLLCDRTRLYQIFSNLIGNALDHMGRLDDAVIEIDVVDEGDSHRITVRDNGRGIDPKHHERIFQIFQSLGPRRDGSHGTGVGLAIVKKIAEVHGGSVQVESEAGKGAAFHVRLPQG